MSIEKWQFLYFVPPELDGDSNVTKKRYMLILNIDNNNTVEMINVSSIKGKEKKLFFDSNVIIKSYAPLPVPSFAKLDVVYTVNNFDNLKKYVAFNGAKISKQQFANIKFERYKYIKKSRNKTKVINYSQESITELN